MCADKKINKMSSKEGKIFISVLRVEKGYGAKNIITEFPRKTDRLLPLITCYVRLIQLGLPSAEKTTDWRMATL